ncbi:ABC transporter substrate-binding protein OS=Rhizobacter sp. Root404 OX=1736528 GN=ASC76_03210 PE=3 SV=1 [Rhizobacter fulvus]
MTRFTSSRRQVLAALGALALPALAQTPNADRPMRVILPVGAGSGVDTIMRAASPALAKALGQPVVIENLPGAGGITGTTALVRAAPDGATIGVVSNNHVVNPSVYKKMPFDALADITPISVIGETPFVLVVNPAHVPAKNVRELVAFLKAKPGAYNYASSGNGTIIHLAGAMFVEAAQAM